MLIVPYSTDAPIYHYPWATIGMIATNVVIEIARIALPPETFEPYALELGTGLHPLQWVTTNFMHAGLVHLIGNMIFLWTYGIIVEGKLGWFPFILCYLGMGTVYGASIQVAYLGAKEPSYVVGASAVIFGLMALCMIWAPTNDLSCFYLFIFWFRIFTGTFEVPIYGFAILQLIFEGVEVGWSAVAHGDPMSSGLLHVSGAFWGLLLGVVMVKLNLVDCEGWDVFSMAGKRKRLSGAWKQREARLDRAKVRDRGMPVARFAEEAPPPVMSAQERAAKLLARLHKAIDAGDAFAIQNAYDAWSRAVGDDPAHADLVGVIRALHERELILPSVPAMRQYCRAFPERSAKVRLKLATILLRNLERPTEARRLLEPIDDSALDARLMALRRKLMDEAKRLIDEGVLELEEG